MAEVEQKKEVATEPKQETQEEFEGNVKVSNKVPTQADLDKCAELLLLDENNVSRTFKSLYTSESTAPRQLIIFVRHFFCGNCQEYLRTLCSSMSTGDLLHLSPPTSIIVIGCGNPSLIPMYRETTNCEFPIYADPTQKLYEHLGMVRTWDLGPKKPEYMQNGVLAGAVTSIVQALKSGKDALKGGDMKQIGGEFLFEDGKVTWCHRMRNTRDHAEVLELRALIGLDDSRPPMRKTWSSNIMDLKRRSSSWGRRPKEENGATNGDRAAKESRRRSFFGGAKKTEQNGEKKEEADSVPALPVEPLTAEPAVPAQDPTNPTVKAVEQPLELTEKTQDAGVVGKPLDLVPEKQAPVETEATKANSTEANGTTVDTKLAPSETAAVETKLAPSEIAAGTANAVEAASTSK